MSNQNNKNKDKGKAKISFRAMIIAMIIALLGFLGFGGFELGNGNGADTDEGNNSGIVSEVENSENSNTDGSKSGTADDIKENLDVYTIYVREDKILVLSEEGQDGYKEVDLTYVEEMLATFSSDKRVLIYDDGAINKTYEEVVALVDKSELRKIEEKVSNN